MRLPLLAFGLIVALPLGAQVASVRPDPAGGLVYRADALGNQIPDFSNVGYHGGDAALPLLPVAVTVEPAPGDAGARIQAAINHVAKLTPDAHGWRGAVLLKKGHYPIAGSVVIAASGIVLRGEGDGPDDTVLVATGTKQRSLIIVGGSATGKAPKDEDEEEAGGPAASAPIAITDAYVPVGAHTFHVADAAKLTAGQAITVVRPSTAEWIHTIGMDRIPTEPDKKTVQWRAGTKDLSFSRVITKVAGLAITVDAPLTCALDQKFGGGRLFLEGSPSLPTEVGVENLRGESDYQSPDDEKHGWILVDVAQARNAWVKQVVALHFGYSCVYARKAAKWITVEACVCLDPISQITGGRRYSFAIDGQLILVQHCYSRNGRHDFVVHALAAGPDVFYDCVAEKSHADSGPHHRWSVGILYDNVRVSGEGKSGGELNIRNRGNSGTGHGWAGANQVVWNCTADAMIIENPPTAQNWVIGARTPSLTGNGNRESAGHPVLPKSLYLAQLEARQHPAPTASPPSGPSS